MFEKTGETAADGAEHALDLSADGITLYRRRRGGPWSEISHGTLQLGSLTATLTRLAGLAKGSAEGPARVQVWLPEDQVLVRTFPAGTARPEGPARAAAFRDEIANHGPLAYDAGVEAPGPLPAIAAVPRSVVEETVRFLEPYGFEATRLTTGRPPAQLSTAPVFAGPAPAAARTPPPAAPRAAAIAAAAVLALGLSGTAAYWAAGGFDDGDPWPVAINDVRQIGLEPGQSDPVATGTAWTAAGRVAVPGSPDVLVERAPGTLPTRAPDPPGAEALIDTPETNAPAEMAAAVAPGSVAAPAGAPTVGALAAADAVVPNLPATFSSTVQDRVAELVLPGDLEFQDITPGILPAALVLPQAGGLSPVFIASPSDAPAPAPPPPGAPVLVPVQVAMPMLMAQATPVERALPGTPRPRPVVASVDEAVAAVAGDVDTAATTSTITEAGVTVVAARPGLLPPDRGTAPAATPLATPEAAGDTPPEVAPAPTRRVSDLGVVIVAELPDIMPRQRPQEMEDAAPPLEVAALTPDAFIGPRPADPDTAAAAAATPEDAGPDPDALIEQLLAGVGADGAAPLGEVVPDVAAVDPGFIGPPLPPDLAPAPIAAEAADTGVPRLAALPEGVTIENRVLIVTGTPEVTPPLREAPEPKTGNAFVGTGAADPRVIVIAALPQTIPPLRPGTARTPLVDAPNPASDAISALVLRAQEEALEPSDLALQEQAPPRSRPAEMVEEIVKPGEEDLTPTESALKLASGPRARPGDLKVVSLQPVRASAPAAVAPAAAAPSVRQTTASPRLPTTASVARAATIDNAIPMRQIALLGVVGRAGSRQALLRMPNGRIVKVKTGDRVDGADVAAISEDAIRLRRRGRRDEVLVIPE